MSNGTEDRFDASDPAHRRQFRLVVAGAIRNLMAAALWDDPKFFLQPILDRWWPDKRIPRSSPLTLLTSAAGGFEKFRGKYCDALDSVPFVEPSEGEPTPESQIERLRDLLINFTDPESLRRATLQLRKKESPNWREVAEWDLLNEIREICDQLPSPNKKSNTQLVIRDLIAEQPLTVRFPDQSSCTAQKQVFLLLQYLLGKKGHYATRDALKDEIWGHDETVDDQRLDSVLKRARKLFREWPAPFQIQARSGTVSLLRLESTSAPQTKPAKTRKPRLRKSRRKPR